MSELTKERVLLLRKKFVRHGGLEEIVELCDLALTTLVVKDPLEVRIAALEKAYAQLYRETRDAILHTARVR